MDEEKKELSEKKKELVPVLIDWVDVQYYPKMGTFDVRDLKNLDMDNYLSVAFLIKKENRYSYVAQEYFSASEHWRYILVLPQKEINNIVNLEKGPGDNQKIIWVQWFDGFRYDSYYYDFDDLEDIELSLASVVGWVVKETDTHYYLARSYLPESEQFEKLFTVPKQVVESIFELRKIDKINENEEKS